MIEEFEVEIIVRGGGKTYTATFPKSKVASDPWEIDYYDPPRQYISDDRIFPIRHIKEMKFCFAPLLDEETLEYGQIVVGEV